MNFKWSEIYKPVYCLAPMANITTKPFRQICKKYGADIVFTPMLSSNALIHNPEDTLKIAEFDDFEQPVIVQVFGYDGEIMAQAAKIVDEKLHPAGIDLNMGCPAPKITGNECGSALLKDQKKAVEIAKAVRKAYRGQLSVKLRLGWSENDILPLVKELESIGIDAISIHGRTAKQGYRGEADWDPIYNVAEELSIPVLGNGDISTYKEAISRVEGTRLAGALIGRETLNSPWIFKEIKEKAEFSPTRANIIDLCVNQLDATINYLGEERRAVIEMRKFFGKYIKGFKNAAEVRIALNSAESREEAIKIINRLI